MKVVLNVFVENLEDKINRYIEVDENINLNDLCEFIIVSMNGKNIPNYILKYRNITYYPWEGKAAINEKRISNIKLKDLKLKKGKKFDIDYNFDRLYRFNVVVDNIINSTNDSIFNVISGNGYGILDNERMYYFRSVLYNELREDRYNKNIQNYLQQVFDVIENNIKIKEYIEHRKEKMKPQRYVFNISLKDFDKEIKRKISINNNVTINEFCKNIVLSMKGDLSHGYGIKISGEFLNEYYDGVKLYYLDLKEKKKLKIIYDWGDGWTFNVTVSKIIDNYGDEECEVLSGKGYGIVDDCGGIWALKKIFAGEDKSWGDYDINDFDLEKCNNIIRKNS